MSILRGTSGSPGTFRYFYMRANSSIYNENLNSYVCYILFLGFYAALAII